MQNVKNLQETVMWGTFKIGELLNILLLKIILEFPILKNITCYVFTLTGVPVQYYTMQIMFTEANAFLKIEFSRV